MSDRRVSSCLNDTEEHIELKRKALGRPRFCCPDLSPSLSSLPLQEDGDNEGLFVVPTSNAVDDTLFSPWSLTYH